MIFRYLIHKKYPLTQIIGTALESLIYLTEMTSPLVIVLSSSGVSLKTA